MTKDEAKAAVMRLMRAECTCGIPGVKEPCFACEMSAGLDVLAQACVDAALEIERNTIIVQEANHDEGQYEEDADTLGMLELIAKRTDETVELGRVTVEYQAGRGTYIYSIHYDDDLRHGWFDVSRAEVEALLKEAQNG